MSKFLTPAFGALSVCILGACSISPLSNLSGFACESDGTCADGYTCDGETNICITNGDDCADEGREVFCSADATDCADGGCRVCEDGSWTDCEVPDCTPEAEIPCNGDDEDCDGSDGTETGTDANCAGCNDSCGAGNGVATAHCDTSGSGPTCVVDSCDPGLLDADGDYGTGCELTCVATNGGIETCDGLDNDCNSTVDDILSVDADCNLQLPAVNVTAWACTAGACAVTTCDTDFHDIDGDGTNGCEFNCTPSNGGIETCDGSDNDCNDVIDDVVDTTTDCQTIHAGATDVLGFACEGALCVVDICVAGMEDDNDDPSDGCEAVCAQTNGGVEQCDDDDNDCNGIVDDAADGASGCSDFFLDSDQDTFGVAGDSRCMCNEDALYTATVDTDCDDTWALCTTDCSDTDTDTVADCRDDCVDTDSDGLGDGAFDTSGCANATPDSDDANANACADVDADGCDDCAVTSWDMADDGTDTDSDGICDAGDACTDFDGDGLGNGNLGNTDCVDPTDDSDDNDSNVCADVDLDTCEDCLSGTWDPMNDGQDTNGDGVCDAAPPCIDDADGDGLGDGSNGNIGCALPDNDSDDSDQFACIDSDADGCDDCSSGTFDIANDGTDSDGDTICDLTDICPSGDDRVDTDGDSVPDDCDPCPGTEAPGATCGTCQSCDGAGNCGDDLFANIDCPLCQQCAAGGTCVPQADTDDLKNECAMDSCNTGLCDGAGACTFEAAGLDCGTCQQCDGAGLCIDDLAQDTDCGACEECAAGGICANQAAGSDINNDCTNPNFCDGDEECDGNGGCQDAADPCAVGQCDEGADVCGCSNDNDCPTCQECQGAPGGTCVDQALGDDVKNDCTLDSCNTGDCDGSGACEFETNGTDCGQCQECDGSGACIDDLAQDNDCGFCEECAAGGTCTDQGSSSDVKSQCTLDDCNTGNCDGAGACGFVANATPCTDDNQFCTGAETCDGAGNCQSAGDPCTAGGECADTCQEGPDNCNTTVGTVCTQNSNYCDGAEECDGAGSCGSPGDPCVGGGDCNDTCNESADDCFDPITTACNDDGQFCNGAEQCNGSGSCNSTGVDPCASGGDCNDTCQEGPDNCFTSSGVACTQNSDFCDGVEECNGAGSCGSPGDPCAGGSDCNDTCNEAADDCFDPITTACNDDGLFCTGVEQCNGAGACNGTGDPCAAGGECTNVCNDTVDNCNVASGTPCTSDGAACNGIEECDGSGACGSPGSATDGTACDEGAGADGNACNSSCQSGTCTAASNATAGEACDDGIACTAPIAGDSCDGSGTCSGAENDTLCDALTSGDLCAPDCTPAANGCVTPPTSVALGCTDPVTIGNNSDCTITVAGGDTQGQAACLPCYAEVGVTQIDFTDWDTGAGVCDLDGWTVITGDECYQTRNTCPQTNQGGANCCNNFRCPATRGGLNGDIAFEADSGSCTSGDDQWRVEKTFDTTGLTDIRVCFDFAENGADSSETLQIEAEDASNFAVLECWQNGPLQWRNDVYIRRCYDLPAWAANNGAATLRFLMYSSNNDDAIVIDNIEVTGWSGGCAANIPTLFNDDFEGNCPLTAWTTVGAPSCVTGCDGDDTVAAVNTNWSATTTGIDATAIDGNVELCFKLGGVDTGGGEQSVISFNRGTGWQTAWNLAGTQSADSVCNPVCVDLSAIDPGINHSTFDLRLQLASDNNNDPIWVDDLVIRGAQYCQVTNAEVAISAPPTDNADDTYSFTAGDAYGDELDANIWCYWDHDPTIEDTDTVHFNP